MLVQRLFVWTRQTLSEVFTRRSISLLKLSLVTVEWPCKEKSFFYILNHRQWPNDSSFDESLCFITYPTMNIAHGTSLIVMLFSVFVRKTKNVSADCQKRQHCLIFIIISVPHKFDKSFKKQASSQVADF